MKFTLSWLKKHLHTNHRAEELSQGLTNLGLVVDRLTNPADSLRGFLVARIVSTSPHPQADRLQVCQVDTGPGGMVQVVCGASNARPGLVSVLGLPGLKVPGLDMTLKESTIRGVGSQGMLCSAAELSLAEESDGILELPDTIPLGTEYGQWLGLDDPCFDVEITPNRGDALSIHGIARDLAAAQMGELKPLENFQVSPQFPCSIKVIVDDPMGCPLYMGRTLRGLKNQESPSWLQECLRSIGLRPISAIVDVTNFLAHDRGRPLHAFDQKKLGSFVHIRSSKNGEIFKGLDGQETTLDEGLCVIGHGHEFNNHGSSVNHYGPSLKESTHIAALGGVMGSLDTACDLETTEIFLESAYFSPDSVAKIGQKTHILSDSRYRFERHVDPGTVAQGLDDATHLILSVCGGEASEIVTVGAIPSNPDPILFDPSLVLSHGGVSCRHNESLNILQDLGFHVEKKLDDQLYKVTPPSWRRDCTIPEDLVEEILRVKGYDHIVSTPIPSLDKIEISKADRNQEENGLHRSFDLRRVLSSRGFHEVMTWSFINESQHKMFGGHLEPIPLDNPINQDFSHMRSSLLPHMLEGIRHNQSRGYTDISFFEVGERYHGNLIQENVLVGLRCGNIKPAMWCHQEEKVNPFHMKDDLFHVFLACGLKENKFQYNSTTPDYYHPGRSIAIVQGQKVLAYFGMLHPLKVSEMGIEGDVGVFEMFLDAIPFTTSKNPPLKMTSQQRFHKDLAFILHRDIKASQVIQAVRKTDPQLIAQVSIFDRYTGPGIKDEHYSLGIRFYIQPQNRTLTDEDILGLMDRVIQQVQKATKGELRT
jgi:phenylalanyl-tRNA synthetase beta chain